ncbi:MAG: glycosyltransferase [Clostridia bacterium]|nr:glycosyltransferase [Clostridia bacterium]
MSVKVSVIIPVYNAGEYLAPCLDSVLAQTVSDCMEIILVDDGSTDSSGRVCDEYAARYDNIRVFHGENSGVSKARNKGIENASGEFLGFVDADDLIEPQMYEKLYNTATKTGADIAFCGIRHPYPDKEVVIEYPFETEVLLGKEKIRTDIADFLINDASLNSLCNKLFKREKIKDLRLTVGRKYGEDREFFIKALIESDGVCSVPFTGYYYRYVETSAVQKPRFDYGIRISQQYESDLELFSKLGIDSESFRDKSASFFASSVIGALSFADAKFTGKNRKAVMKSIIDDEALQNMLTAMWDKILERQSSFGIMILTGMRKRSIASIRGTLKAMRIKVALINILRGTK